MTDREGVNYSKQQGQQGQKGPRFVEKVTRACPEVESRPSSFNHLTSTEQGPVCPFGAHWSVVGVQLAPSPRQSKAIGRGAEAKRSRLHF